MKLQVAVAVMMQAYAARRYREEHPKETWEFLDTSNQRSLKKHNVPM
jgi:hypothetical protein